VPRPTLGATEPLIQWALWAINEAVGS
jgi:hypothetical protein